MMRLALGFSALVGFTLGCGLIFVWALWGVSELIPRDRYWLAVVFGLGAVGGVGLCLILWQLVAMGYVVARVLRLWHLNGVRGGR